jgi:PAS domain S-box-containing protein
VYERYCQSRYSDRRLRRIDELVLRVWNVCDRKETEDHGVTDFPVVDAGTRQVLEAMPDAVLLVDQHGAIRYANQMPEHIFGYARSELLGSPIETLIPERFRHRHVEQRQAYIDHPHRRETGRGLGLLGLRRDGAEFPVDISLSPFEICTLGDQMARSSSV